PRGRAAGPNVHRWPHRGRIVQSACAHHGELRPRGRVGRQLAAAAWTKAMPDFVPAVGGPGEFAELSRNFQCRRRYQHIDGTVGGYVLAVSAPADSDRERFGRKAVAYCAAKTMPMSVGQVIFSVEMSSRCLMTRHRGAACMSR